jgi:hypothetical protein
MGISYDPPKAVYCQKRSCNIPHEIDYLMHRVSDWRSLPYNRSHSLKMLNKVLFQADTIIVAMADQLPLSMGIFSSTYHSSLFEVWCTIESVNGFKSVLPITGEPDSIGHYNRLLKFGAYPILEKY